MQSFRIASICCLFASLAVPVGAHASPPDVQAILKRSDKNEAFKSNYAEMHQVIVTTGGTRRTLAMRAWAINTGDKQLVEYISPADIKGQKLLMTDDGDNIWMFNPETRRTRKLGSHMKKKKVMGSDFTYEDQSGGNFSEKYTGTIVANHPDGSKQGGVDCFVLDLRPTPEGPSYDKVVAWLGRDDAVMRRVDFFEAGAKKPFKRLVADDIRKVGSKWVAYKMTMTNLEDGSETMNVITRMQFGANIPESIFESRNLQR